MKLIRNIGEGIMLVVVLLAMGIICLFGDGTWSPYPEGEDQ